MKNGQSRNTCIIVGLELTCLAPLSTIFHLYCGNIIHKTQIKHNEKKKKKKKKKPKNKFNKNKKQKTRF